MTTKAPDTAGNAPATSHSRAVPGHPRAGHARLRASGRFVSLCRFVAAVSLLCTLALPAAADTDDFEGLPTTFYYSGGTANVGGYYPWVTFGPAVTILDAAKFGFNNGGYPPHSGTAVAASIENPQFDIQFGAPARNVSFWYTCYYPVTATAYRNDGSTEVQTLAPNYTQSSQAVFSGSGIVRIEIAETPNYFTLDDLSFDVASEVLYHANLHSHTTYSDGHTLGGLRPESLSPTTAYVFARGHGLQVMAVTDHGEQLDSTEWASSLDEAQAATHDGFVGLRGFEWTHTLYHGVGADLTNIFGVAPTSYATGSGHANVFGSLERVGAYTDPDTTQYPPDVPWKGSRGLFYDWLVANEYATTDGRPVVAQFNHPTTYDNSDHFNDYSLPDGASGASLRDIFDLMEVGAHSNLGYEGGVEDTDSLTPQKSNEYWFRTALDNGWRVAPTNNEDNHTGQYGTDGRFTGIYAPNLSGMDAPTAQGLILDALRARHVFASENPDSRVLLRAYVTSAPGVDRMMGDVLQTRRGDAVTLHLEAALDQLLFSNRITRVQLIGPTGYPVQSWAPGLLSGRNFTGEATLSQQAMDQMPKTLTGELYVYAKVEEDDGSLLFSAPIWVRGPHLTPTAAPRRQGDDVIATVTLTNTGTGEASDVQITGASLGNVILLSALPLGLDTIAVGGSKSADLDFANAGAAGTTTVLRVSGTYAGSTFALHLRVRLP